MYGWAYRDIEDEPRRIQKAINTYTRDRHRPWTIKCGFTTRPSPHKQLRRARARMLWNCETSSEMFGGWSHWELCQTASRDHHRSPSGLTMELSWPQALGRFSAIPELHGRLEEEDLRPTDARKSTHSSLSEGRSILKRYQGFGGMRRSLGAFRFSETG